MEVDEGMTGETTTNQAAAAAGMQDSEEMKMDDA